MQHRPNKHPQSRILFFLLSGLCLVAGLGSAVAKEDVGQTAAATHGSDSVRVLLAASRETTLASRIQGMITNMAVSHGQSFAKDKVLVTFDCGEQTARLAMAQAERATARENYQGKVRMQGLQQASEVDVALAAGMLSRAKAQVSLYSLQQQQCQIKAPFAGRVVKLNTKAYESVSPGQPLLEIVGTGPLVLRVNVPSVWLAWIQPGVGFKVRIDETGADYEAKVSALNGRVDAASQTIEIEGVLLKEAKELLPGMSGTAQFSRPLP